MARAKPAKPKKTVASRRRFRKAKRPPRPLTKRELDYIEFLKFVARLDIADFLRDARHSLRARNRNATRFRVTLAYEKAAVLDRTPAQWRAWLDNDERERRANARRRKERERDAERARFNAQLRAEEAQRAARKQAMRGGK